MSCWTLARLLSQWEKKRVCKEEKIQMCAERAPFAYSLSNLSCASFLWRALLSSGRNYSREEAVLVSLLDFCPALGMRSFSLISFDTAFIQDINYRPFLLERLGRQHGIRLADTTLGMSQRGSEIEARTVE